MKTKLLQFLLMGALAIGITSNAMAAEDKQLCFQINGDINNSTQIAKAILTVNSAGVATGTECFYSITDKSATPSCGPLLGTVNGKYPQAFLSLTGNWQRNIGPDVVSEDTNVSVHYNFKKLSGEGIAKTFKTIGTAPPQEVNSSEGSVSRIACQKPVANILQHLRALPAKVITITPKPLSSTYPTAQSTDLATTVIVGNLEVQSSDSKDGTGNNVFNWTAAKSVAQSYGPGWHLPTKQELNLLYKNKVVVGGFTERQYWSSTQEAGSTAWDQDFRSGFQFPDAWTMSNRVRAVKVLQ